MKINIFWVIGLSIGNLIGGIFNSGAESIQFFNTLCILLTAVYIIQNETKVKDIE